MSALTTIKAMTQLVMEGGRIEISLRLLKSYGNANDLKCIQDAVTALVSEGLAKLIKRPEECDDGDVSIVMLRYPGGFIPYEGYVRVHNRAIEDCQFLSREEKERSKI